MALFVAPFAIVLAYSLLTRGGPYGGLATPWTLENYQRLVDPLYAVILLRSFVMAAVATAICLLLAFPAGAFHLARGPAQEPISAAGDSALLDQLSGAHLRLAVPAARYRTDQYRAAADRASFTARCRCFITMARCCWAWCTDFCRSWCCPSTPRWSGWTRRCWKPRRILGAKPWTALLRVIVPLSQPGIRAGAILVFIPCLGAYLTPDLLGGGRTVMIGNLVQNQFTTARDWPFGSAVSAGADGAWWPCWWWCFCARDQESWHEAHGWRLRGGHLRVSPRAAADAGRIQLQLLALHRVGGIFSALVPGHVPRSAACRRRVEQRHHRGRRHADFDRRRHALRLRAVEAAARACISGALYLSLVTPEIVTGVSLLALFQWTFRWLHWRLGLYTVILAHVAFSIAYVVIVVSARLRTYNRPWKRRPWTWAPPNGGAFWYVTLPALLPGHRGRGAAGATVSFDDYVITSMVAGVDSETLPMVIYAMARRGASPVINAISALVTVFFGSAGADARSG